MCSGSTVTPRSHDRRMSWDTLWRSSRRQLGLFTLDQARAAGITWEQVRGRVRSGELCAVRRGVYSPASPPSSWERDLLAACMAVGPATWIAQRTAARLWGLTRVRWPDGIDLLTPVGKKCALNGVVHHRSAVIPTTDLTARRSVPVTTPARTIVDCLPFIRPDRLGKVVDQARRELGMTTKDLAACMGRLDHGGGRLIVPLRAVLADRIRQYGAGDSDRELWVLGILLDGGLPVPSQQHHIVVEGRDRFADFAYPEWKIVLEFQGYWEHVENRSRYDDDADRNGGLAADGWTVIPVTSRTEQGHLVARVARAIARCAA